jgi:hypothetical protein
MVKKDLDIMEMFHIISEKTLTPNQFYLLCCLRENEASININLHQELRILTNDKWLTKVENAYIISPAAHLLIDQVESFFKVHKKKTDTQVMGQNHMLKIEEYILLFPKGKLPSGKSARSDKKNLETCFKWFFETHDYSWDIILKATAIYVDSYERNNFMYMQTSQYFIRKQQSDKTWGSELANCCANLENGNIEQDDTHFTEKVV